MTQQERFNLELIDRKADDILNNIEAIEVHTKLFKELDKYFRHEEYEEDWISQTLGRLVYTGSQLRPWAI